MEKLYSILNEIRPEADFESSDNFVEDGYLDSFDIVSLVTEIDKEYSISLDGVDILPENFKNIDSIIELLKKYGINEWT